MCPDNKLLSAFYDGEVSSPWKEKIEDHILNCKNCRAVLNSFDLQTRFLHSEEEPEILSGFEDLQTLIRHKQNINSQPGSPFKMSLRPLVAVAASALLAFLFGFFVANPSEPSGSSGDMSLAVSEDWSLLSGSISEEEDIEAMLSFIDEEGNALFSQEASMDLPLNLNLARLGDPQLIKNADYRGLSH